jgi:hypothetical protein
MLHLTANVAMLVVLLRCSVRTMPALWSFTDELVSYCTQLRRYCVLFADNKLHKDVHSEARMLSHTTICSAVVVGRPDCQREHGCAHVHNEQCMYVYTCSVKKLTFH